jgi:hypothetical protein
MTRRNAVKVFQFVVVLVFAGFVSAAWVQAQPNRPEPPPPGGMGIGPPSMGEWYRPPTLENKTPPPLRSVLEFAPNSKEKQLLAVGREDLQTNAAFLRGRDTGAFRLLPPHPFTRHVVNANSPAVGWRPGFSAFASTYSFVKKKHGHGVNGYGEARFGWSELKLSNGMLLAAIMDQSLGLMVQLGDVPLETVTTSTNGVAELVRLVPPADQAGALTLFQQHLRGYEVDEFVYKSRLRISVNTTYVLRSILNKRSDQLVAFRVVRRDEDGGVTIFWRQLEKYSKPKWKAPKGRK